MSRNNNSKERKRPPTSNKSQREEQKKESTKERKHPPTSNKSQREEQKKESTKEGKHPPTSNKNKRENQKKEGTKEGKHPPTSNKSKKENQKKESTKKSTHLQQQNAINRKNAKDSKKNHDSKNTKSGNREEQNYGENKQSKYEKHTANEKYVKSKSNKNNVKSGKKKKLNNSREQYQNNDRTNTNLSSKNKCKTNKSENTKSRTLNTNRRKEKSQSAIDQPQNRTDQGEKFHYSFGHPGVGQYIEYWDPSLGNLEMSPFPYSNPYAMSDMYMEASVYGDPGCEEVMPPLDVPINEFGFGDEYFFFEGNEGEPKYKNANEPWEQVIAWLETVTKRLRKKKNYEETTEYWIGQEVLRFLRLHNAHSAYLKMKMYWVPFRDTYLLAKDCPEYVIDFIRGIMCHKMTEKQMWGTDEDRMPEGTVIIFDKRLMPEEGEDTGKLKFEYHPNWVEERMEAMRRGEL